MKIFFSESKPEYASYTFNYGIYCIRENDSELTDIYNQGFLPYSGNIELKEEVFYLARSLRVELNRFEDTSENRRVDKKIAELNIQVEVLEKSEIMKRDVNFLAFCESYISERIGEAMSPERLLHILSMNIGTHFFRFSSAGKPLGYVLALIRETIVHYWFSFFDIELMKSHSLGKWMMWRVIRWAADHGKAVVYLGTAYGDKALYKVRDHKGLAFFDGVKWNRDMEQLKDWCKTDKDRDATDRFKLAEDGNDYLARLWT